MQDDIAPIQPTESSKVQKQEQAEARKMAINQEASQINMLEYGQEAAFNAVEMSRKFEKLEEKYGRARAEKKEADNETEVVEVEEVEKLTEEFQRKNPELEARALKMLRGQVSGRDSSEEILRKTMKSFADPSLADEALDYLEQTSRGDLAKKVAKAKENLNSTYGREVAAGRNMGAEARAFSKEGLGSPTGLRDLYRDITGNPREATTLFEELQGKFDYEKLQTATNFLLHSMGADLKAKGPSIPPGELHTLMTECRNVLAILWVYKFFRGRMDLIASSFERSGMLMPSRITFEMLAKMFIAFLRERYPSMDKVFQLALKMGISADLLAQVILFTQMRDAVRGVAPKLYRSEQHRHDVLMSFIEALEEIEEQLEEEEEEEEDEEEEE